MYTEEKLPDGSFKKCKLTRGGYNAKGGINFAKQQSDKWLKPLKTKKRGVQQAQPEDGEWGEVRRVHRDPRVFIRQALGTPFQEKEGPAAFHGPREKTQGARWDFSVESQERGTQTRRVRGRCTARGSSLATGGDRLLFPRSK